MKPQNILIALAPNQSINNRYQAVFEFANSNHSQIYLLCVINELQNIKLPINHQGSALDLLTLAENQVQAHLESLIKTLNQDYPQIIFHTLISAGSPDKQIIAQCESLKIDFLVIDANSPLKTSAVQFGSTTRQLMRKINTPVWALSQKTTHKINRIAVALDVTDESSQALTLNKNLLKTSADLALANNSELHLLHIWSLEEEGYLRHWSGYSDLEIATLAKKEKQLRSEKVYSLIEEANILNTDIHIELIEGKPETKLPEYTQINNIDLLVMGTDCRTGLSSIILGNTAEKMLDCIRCSLLTIKSKNQ